MGAGDKVLKTIVEEIQTSLMRSGIMYRIFYRAKSPMSINKKMMSKAEGYRAEGKKMQDLLALRITLYFADDVKVVYQYFKSQPTFDSESIDRPEVDRFHPTRLNLVMKVSDDLKRDMNTAIHDTNYPDLIDDTYEIQIRTILSEGWHEVEHDLRYKCKDEWSDYPDESRLLNGIFASLESNEWSMLSLFERLSYSHYKKSNWNSMIRNKFRIRFVDDSLSQEMSEYLTLQPQVAKKIFKSNRLEMLEHILREGFTSPLTYDTTIHLLNHIEIKDEGLAIMEDPTLKEELDSLFGTIK